MVLKKILDALSLKAVRHRLDKRKLQEELDLHRLFLLTAFHSRHGTAAAADVADDLAAALDAEARELGAEGCRTQVSGFLSQQLSELTTALHVTLEAAGDAGPSQRLAEAWIARQIAPPTPQRGLGAGFAASGASAAAPGPPAPFAPLKLTQDEVADAFLRSVGFTLRVAPSSVPHADAGDGVWLHGSAGTGQVVALYPGTAYPPLFHRNIPGYPLVARSNPFLLSRFDGVVLDAKPWGRGDAGDGSAWPAGDLQNEAEAGLKRLEGRHPLALAQWANHPPAGTQPNVVVAAVDWTAAAGDLETRGKLRACVPVVQYMGDEKELPGLEDPAPCVALVATREVQDEELFLNYRLNPNAPGGLPEWYTAVDADEDARRWA